MASQYEVCDLFPPGLIAFAIAHYVSPDPASYIGEEHFNSTTGTEWRHWLLSEGLIDDCGTPTARMKAWIEHLCAQPLPEMTWQVIPGGLR